MPTHGHGIVLAAVSVPFEEPVDPPAAVPAGSDDSSDESPGMGNVGRVKRPVPLGLAIALAALSFLTWIVGTAAAGLILGRRGIEGQVLAALIGQGIAILSIVRSLRLLQRAFDLTPDDLGVRFSRDLWQRVGRGLQLYFAALPGLFLIGVLVSYLAERYRFPVDRPEIRHLLTGVKGHPAAVALFFVMATVGAPFFEELLFRGLLYSSLRTRWSTVLSILTTAVLFAYLHEPYRIFTDPRAFPLPILYLGIVLGLARERTSSVVPGMVMHALNNALAFALSLRGMT